MGSKGRVLVCSSSRVVRLYIKSEKERNSAAAGFKKKVFHELDKGKKSDTN